MQTPPISHVLARNRFTLVTMLLLAYLFVLAPAHGESGFWAEFVNLTFTAIVVTSVYACVSRGRVGVLLAASAVPAIVLLWATRLSNSDQIVLANHAVTGAVLLLIAMLILADVGSSPRITHDSVAGALAAYLIIGLVFSHAYAAVYALDPTSFSLPDYVGDSATPGSATVLRVFTYFSFVTLSTLGYGDATPTAPSMQAAAALEAILGQIYLAVMVARLVALQVSHGSRARS